MSDAATPTAPKKKGLMMPMAIGLVLALLGGAGGFFAAQSGLLPAPGMSDEAGSKDAKVPIEDVEFVPVDPLVISIGRAANNRHLRFLAQLEVPGGKAAQVAQIMPRIVDTLNGYLRAVDVRDFEEPTALIRLRAQMLRRVQIVAGDGLINDLLIMEFVLN